MTEHIDSVRTYALVWLALLALTAVTTPVAFVDLGAFSVVVALAIAVCKMLLVALFFMHVRHSTKLTKLVVLGGLLWLADPAHADPERFRHPRLDRRAGTVGQTIGSWSVRPRAARIGVKTRGWQEDGAGLLV